MNKEPIQQEIERLLTTIQNQFKNICTKTYTPEDAVNFLNHVNELNKKTAVWDFLNAHEAIKSTHETIRQTEIPSVDIIEKEEPQAPLFEQAAETKRPEEKAPTMPVKEESKIIDIKQNIGIGDKFEFINELFNGNASEYDDAIKQMNSSSTAEQIQMIFETLKKKYKWNNENESANKLWELIKNSF